MTIDFIQYVRDRKNRRRGLLLVSMKDKTVSLGWSLCCTSRGDQFDREFGQKIASERREIGIKASNDRKEKRNSLTFSIDDHNAQVDARNEIPHSMRETFDRVIDRCERITNKKAIAVV